MYLCTSCRFGTFGKRLLEREGPDENTVTITFCDACKYVNKHVGLYIYEHQNKTRARKQIEKKMDELVSFLVYFVNKQPFLGKG